MSFFSPVAKARISCLPSFVLYTATCAGFAYLADKMPPEDAFSPSTLLTMAGCLIGMIGGGGGFHASCAEIKDPSPEPVVARSMLKGAVGVILVAGLFYAAGQAVAGKTSHAALDTPAPPAAQALTAPRYIPS